MITGTVRIFGRAGIGMMLASTAFSFGSARAAVILSNSAPFVLAAQTCTGSPSAPHPCERPGRSDAFNVSDTGGFEEHSEAAADPFGPNAAVRGETIGALGLPRAFAMAELDWQAVVTPMGAGLVLSVSQVPVSIAGSVDAAASGDTADALAQLSTPFGSLFSCSAVGAGEAGFCAGITNSTGITTLTGFVAPNIPIDLAVVAVGAAANSANFEAMADPVLAIADALIPGTDINFRDAFTLSVSSDVTQSLTPAAPHDAPEPATLPVLAMGVFALTGWRVMHRRRSAA
jgi:hypothetical protein